MSGQRVDFTPGGKPVTHGGAGTAYANYGCRCDECTTANTKRVKRRVAERMLEDPPVHGTESAYSNWGCRCPECLAAGSRGNRRRYLARKKQATS